MRNSLACFRDSREFHKGRDSGLEGTRVGEPWDAGKYQVIKATRSDLRLRAISLVATCDKLKGI